MGDRAIRNAWLNALVLAAVLLALLPTQAQAWGFYAHRQTASIAEANVSPQVRAKIKRLLRSEKALGTPECPLRTLEGAAVWADCVRGEGWRWGATPQHGTIAPRRSARPSTLVPIVPAAIA